MLVCISTVVQAAIAAQNFEYPVFGEYVFIGELVNMSLAACYGPQWLLYPTTFIELFAVLLNDTLTRNNWTLHARCLSPLLLLLTATVFFWFLRLLHELLSVLFSLTLNT